MGGLLVEAARPGWTNTNRRTCCLRNHWCARWSRLSACVAAKGQRELDVAHIQRWEFISVGSFFFFFFSQRRHLPGWHIASRYSSSLAFPSYLCYQLLSSALPPSRKEKKSLSLLCNIVADSHLISSLHPGTCWKCLCLRDAPAATAEELINIGKKTTSCLDSHAAR